MSDVYNYLKSMIVCAQPLRQAVVHNLIVSMTTLGKRSKALDLTLLSLLCQTRLPEHINVYADATVIGELSKSDIITSNKRISLIVNKDIGPHTKLLPALCQYPDKRVITVDDDCYYWPTFIEELLTESEIDPKAIIGHRGHYIASGANGQIAPYKDWLWNVRVEQAVDQRLIFLTGVAGCLYPPSPFSSKFFDESLILALAPTADDIWFYFAALSSGVPKRLTGSRLKIHCWPGTQEECLFNANYTGGNDTQFAACLEYFGDVSVIIANALSREEV